MMVTSIICWLTRTWSRTKLGEHRIGWTRSFFVLFIRCQYRICVLFSASIEAAPESTSAVFFKWKMNSFHNVLYFPLKCARKETQIKCPTVGKLSKKTWHTAGGRRKHRLSLLFTVFFLGKTGTKRKLIQLCQTHKVYLRLHLCASCTTKQANCFLPFLGPELLPTNKTDSHSAHF